MEQKRHDKEQKEIRVGGYGIAAGNKRPSK